MNELAVSDTVLDDFDRQMRALDGLPDLLGTKASPIREVNFLGQVETWIVQTFRQRDRGDFVFIELTNRHGHTRIVFPPSVARLVGRQRDALTKRNASKAARERAKRRTTPARQFTAADRKKAAQARSVKAAKRKARKSKRAAKA